MIIPTDELLFSRGVAQPPTRYIVVYVVMVALPGGKSWPFPRNLAAALGASGDEEEAMEAAAQAWVKGLEKGCSWVNINPLLSSISIIRLHVGI